MNANITHLVQQFRMASRDIWNDFMRPFPDTNNWERIEAFRRVQMILFQVLVNQPLGIKTKQVFGNSFRVRPKADQAGASFAQFRPNESDESLPLCLHIGKNRGPILGSEIDLSAVELFDFSVWGTIHFRYCLVRIHSCSKYPEIVGRHAVVEMEEAEFFWLPSQELSAITENCL